MNLIYVLTRIVPTSSYASLYYCVHMLILTAIALCVNELNTKLSTENVFWSSHKLTAALSSHLIKQVDIGQVSTAFYDVIGTSQMPHCVVLMLTQLSNCFVVFRRNLNLFKNAFFMLTQMFPNGTNLLFLLLKCFVRK